MTVLDATRSLPVYRKSARERLAEYAPAIIVTIILAVIVIPPVIVLLRTSLRGNDDGVFTLSHYASLFSDPRLYVSAWNSVSFSVLAMLLSLVNGGLVAWLVERTNVRFKSLAYISAIISLGTPYIIYVSAWLYILGRAGPVNGLYRALVDSTGTLFNVYSITGMVLIEGFLWSPLVFLLLSATFRRSNADMEEAARIAGASVFATVTRISLRLAMPAVLGLGLFVFIRNLEAFDVPVLIGTPSKISLLTTDIYLSMTQVPPQLGHASAFSIVLMFVVAVLLYYYGKISKHAERFASITGKGYRPRPFDLGRSKWLGSALILFNAMLVLVLPLAAILYNSLTPFARPVNWTGLTNLTFDHYRAVFAQSYYLELALNTVIVAAASATAAILITSIAAWMNVRRWPGSALLDQLTSVPLVFPGIVLGVAMIEMALNFPLPVYGTLWVIGFAFVIRYLPYGMRYSHAGIIQIHRELEDAAGISGASRPTILRRILVPLISPSLIAGWLFIFLIAAKELSIAVLLAGYNAKTISVAMFDQWVNGAGGEVAAMGVIWTSVMTIFTATLYMITRRRTDLISGK
ncbi:ABC transporter permease [Chelatococcus asaccharovorans]|uniref:ABC transporter permease n=1 Tax=Chelatococcus asaccharovorans TaxID=28210 RepID=UPI00224C74B5|nr:iron ABC transporter permease [Chelatococcus asaccharovorans]CAH1661399.1 Iron(III) transport system permease protein [Chelatococcus asaccharovorans]CAH1683485.1 Iron(III) transport system permease protein [Chelatococcus asaccharovorans]